MHFIQEHELSEDLLIRFEKILTETDQSFEPSQVYNSKTEEKTVKPETRSSVFRTLTNKELFDIAESLLDKINQKQKSKKFILFRNDVMHIRYEEGGYFKEHEDYLSVTSNVIEEYSLIVCINSTCKNGGRTILRINEYFSTKSTASITRGHCLLFRKDIPHEGELTDGTKEIITFNVWAVESSLNQVLVVKFPNDTRRYCLSFNNISEHPGTLLHTFINTNVGGIKDKPIVEFNCNETYEEFNIINDIYHGKAVSDVRNYRDILDYYGFEYKKLLIKSFITRQVSKPNMIAIGFNDKLKEPDILIFGDQTDYLEYLNKTKEEALPYIPFTVIMAEGRLTFGGEMSGEPPLNIKMCPVFASFTENRNIMFVRNIMGKSVTDRYNPYRSESHCEDLSRIEIGQEFIVVDEDDEDEDEKENQLPKVTISDIYSLEGEPVCYALQATTNASNEELIKIITNRKFEHKFTKTNLDIIDDDKIIARINECDLYDKIKSNLNELSIPNSQRISDNQSEEYCNENVYGNFNLIFIYGFISI